MPQLSVQDRTTCNSCLRCYEVVLAEIHLKELSISLLHGVGGRVQVSGYASCMEPGLEMHHLQHELYSLHRSQS